MPLEVIIYPQSGWLSQPWTSDPVSDRACRLGRSVTAVYSEGLRRARVVHRPRRFVIYADAPATREQAPSVRTAWWSIDRVKPTAGFESAFARFPAELVQWSPDRARQELCSTIHEICRGVALLRGFATEGFDAALEHARSVGYVFTAASGWKVSPDRRLRFRLQASIDADGFGSLTPVVERSTASASVAGSTVRTLGDPHVLRKALRTARWVDATSITFQPLGETPVRAPAYQAVLQPPGADGSIHLQETLPPPTIGEPGPSVIVP